MFDEILEFLANEVSKSFVEIEDDYADGMYEEARYIEKNIQSIIENYKQVIKSENSLTLTEAIIHTENVGYNLDNGHSDLCEGCRAQHRQLAEWLNELKNYRRKYPNEDFFKTLDIRK